MPDFSWHCRTSRALGHPRSTRRHVLHLGVLLALFIWLGQLAIGISQGTALVIALLSFGAMFLFIRLQGGDDPFARRDTRARAGAPARRRAAA
jgi:hypothetical protein